MGDTFKALRTPPLMLQLLAQQQPLLETVSIFLLRMGLPSNALPAKVITPSNLMDHNALVIPLTLTADNCNLMARTVIIVGIPTIGTLPLANLDLPCISWLGRFCDEEGFLWNFEPLLLFENNLNLMHLI